MGKYVKQYTENTQLRSLDLTFASYTAPESEFESEKLRTLVGLDITADLWPATHRRPRTFVPKTATHLTDTSTIGTCNLTSLVFINYSLIRRLLLPGMWSRSRHFGLETQQRLVSVSFWQKMTTSRSRLGYLRLVPKTLLTRMRFCQRSFPATELCMVPLK